MDSNVQGASRVIESDENQSRLKQKSVTLIKYECLREMVFEGTCESGLITDPGGHITLHDHIHMEH